jgi:hypothetical protein
MDLDDSDSNFLYSGEMLGGITDNSSVIESNIKSGFSGNELSMVDETEEEEDTDGWATQKDSTKDICLCRKTDNNTHPIKKKTVEGWHCKFCL